jgi:hypothetical protein
MKRTILTISLIITSLIGISQVSLDSAAFKAYYGEITQGKKIDKGASDLLFYFSGNTLVSSLPENNQARLIHFNTKTTKELTVEGVRFITMQGMDTGGFHCILSLGQRREIYIVMIQYNNLELYFECKKTKERPWKVEDQIVMEQNEPTSPNSKTNMENLESFKYLMKINDLNPQQ